MIRRRPSRVLRRAWRALLPLAALLAPPLQGCDDPTFTEPAFPISAVPLTVPPSYAVWWRVTEQCAGRTGDFAAVHWYVIPGVSDFKVGGESYNGYWWLGGNRIVLAGGSVDDGSLVRHEMLHAIIGHDGHPHAYFVTRCGGVVVCAVECRTEAGSPPTGSPAAPIVDASRLDVTTQVAPDTVSIHARGDWFSITVSAQNRALEPVRVRIATPPTPGGKTYGFRIEPITGSGTVTRVLTRADTLSSFGPGQTKRHVFDLSASAPDSESLAPGTYRVVGWYGPQMAPPVVFTVVP